MFLFAVDPRFGKEAISDEQEATVTRFFFEQVTTTPLGDCATDTKAHMKWSFGPLTGKLLCIATPARARIIWIYDGEDVIATAERDDADRVALYRWWLDEGRSILH